MGARQTFNEKHALLKEHIHYQKKVWEQRGMKMCVLCLQNGHNGCTDCLVTVCLCTLMSNLIRFRELGQHSVPLCSLLISHMLCRTQQAKTTDGTREREMSFHLAGYLQRPLRWLKSFYSGRTQTVVKESLPLFECVVVGEPLHQPLSEGINWVSD